MARAKRVAATPPEPDAPDAPDAPAEDARPWRVGTWAGLPNYSCRRCPYTTLDLERMRSHRCELPTYER